MARIKIHSRYPMMLAVFLLALFGLVTAVLGSDIDPTKRWAWGTNIGWLNFAPDCIDCESVSVYDDHLEGYAWSEGTGWIRLGTHTGGGTHTYANNAADNYGVNNDGSGNLSGYAWGTNVGWIKFDPENGGVTVDMVSGEFDGYAWGENLGWISFNGTAADMTTYNVAISVFQTYLPIVSK